MKTLLANMSLTPPDTGLRQSTLQALGYICEEMGAIHDDVLSQEEINAVLTAVVQVSKHTLRVSKSRNCHTAGWSTSMCLLCRLEC